MFRRSGWGLILVVIGLLLLAANLGYIPPFSVWDLWPLLILWPALKLTFGRVSVEVHADARVRGTEARVRGTDARHEFRFRPPLGLRLVGLWLAVGSGTQLFHNVHLLRYDWGSVFYWTAPLLLVGLGLALMARPGGSLWRWSPWSPPNRAKEFGRPASGASVIAGDLRFGSRPWVFRSPMVVSLWAGDVDVDLTTARLAPGDNYLAMRAWAGEFTVRVPDDVEVTVEAHCGAGELEVFDERREGIGCDLRITRPARIPAGAEPPEGPSGAPVQPPVQAPAQPAARLFIAAALTFGDVRVK